jgi:ribosome biogenesis GTPase
MPRGVVIRSTGSHYRVRSEDGVRHDCVARGNLRIQGFRSTNPIAVGDHVVFEPGDGEKSGTVTEVLDRRNYLVRRSVNLSHQKSVIAANLDQALLMVTLASPRTSTGFIDRFLVTAEAYEVPCVLLFNKVDAYGNDDLHVLDEIEYVYRHAGYRTLRTSGITGLGVSEVKALLTGKVSLLAGHSGVGKSTLINELSMPGTFIIDTPGVKGFGLVEMDAATIADQFPEFFRLKGGCRFSSCTHLHEPGCAVRAALQRGEVAASRYHSYADMVNGVEDEGSYRRE